MRRAFQFLAAIFMGAFLMLQESQVCAQSTQLAPGSLTAGNVTFAFGVDLAGQVLADQAAWGGGFSGFEFLPGGQLSITPIGGSYLSNEQVLFAFAVDNSNHVFFNQAVYGHSWAGWNPAPVITSQFAPASTTSSKQSKVYVFVTAGNFVMVTTAINGSAFGPWSELPGFIAPQASSAPAAITLPEKDTQWVFVQGASESLIYTTMPGGTPTGHWDAVPIGPVALENNGPTAVADATHLYLFATDAVSGHIFMTQSANHTVGTSWGAWQQIGTLQSELSPSAAIMTNGEIMLYATGLNGQIFLAQGSASGVFSDWQQLGAF
jgi:hypothetical protein